jgi:hypothetical protein
LVIIDNDAKIEIVSKVITIISVDAKDNQRFLQSETIDVLKTLDIVRKNMVFDPIK